MFGFDTIKDLMEVVLVPAVGGAVAIYWPELQASTRRRKFRRLIERELKELGPYPESRPVDTNHPCNEWTDHLKKQFVHQKLLGDATENRDFILSLDPDLVYNVSQLWDAYGSKNDVQWLYHLEELAKNHFPDVHKPLQQWKKLIAEYKKHDNTVNAKKGGAT